MAGEVASPTPQPANSVPGLVSPNVTLDDNRFLFEELEVPPAEEAPDVPLDGDGGPRLRAAPPVLQLLIKKLLEKHLRQAPAC